MKNFIIMINVSSYIGLINLCLLALVIISFFTKLVLFFTLERDWDSVKFFHFSKIDLKMTSIKKLRVWRKRQNLLTNLFLVLLGLLSLSTLFHTLIKD
jgi:hypothetical protein